MKLDSNYFDKIRVGRNEPKAAPSGSAARHARGCDARGCDAVGDYRAPKGREREGQYFWFCLDHVRDYNKSYNYFAGMNDEALAAYQRDELTGHRPTWRMGADARGDEARPAGGRTRSAWAARDPYDFFPDGFKRREPEPEAKRAPKNQERKALGTLGLDETADAAEVKARYHALVKRHHPDANGGDRSLEDKLREVIEAYTYLKRTGFC